MRKPPAPLADNKDWTWVLERPCPECGFDAAAIARTDVVDLLKANTADWEQILGGAGEAVRSRPTPTTWSALEYACHVRDVHEIYLLRLTLMLNEDGPHYPNWDQDTTALSEAYHEADPALVAPQLRAAADALADQFGQVAGDQWQRTGYRSDGAAFTIESFARYFIHDPIHHIHDVTRWSQLTE